LNLELFSYHQTGIDSLHISPSPPTISEYVIVRYITFAVETVSLYARLEIFTAVKIEAEFLRLWRRVVFW